MQKIFNPKSGLTTYRMYLQKDCSLKVNKFNHKYQQFQNEIGFIQTEMRNKNTINLECFYLIRIYRKMNLLEYLLH